MQLFALPIVSMEHAHHRVFAHVLLAGLAAPAIKVTPACSVIYRYVDPHAGVEREGRRKLHCVNIFNNNFYF